MQFSTLLAQRQKLLQQARLANLAFVAFGHRHGAADGQAFVFFVMAVAAAEVAVGLAIIVTIFRLRRRLSMDDLSLMRW